MERDETRMELRVLGVIGSKGEAIREVAVQEELIRPAYCFGRRGALHQLLLESAEVR